MTHTRQVLCDTVHERKPVPDGMQTSPLPDVCPSQLGTGKRKHWRTPVAQCYRLMQHEQKYSFILLTTIVNFIACIIMMESHHSTHELRHSQTKFSAASPQFRILLYLSKAIVRSLAAPAIEPLSILDTTAISLYCVSPAENFTS